MSIPQTIADTADLAPLVRRPGPFLTLHLGLEAQIDNAAQRTVQRWKPLRAEAAAGGVPDAVLNAVEELLPDAHQEPGDLVVIADESGVLFAEHLDEGPGDRFTWDRLPDLVPTIASRQRQVPYVLALADRGGADLVAVTAAGRSTIDAEAGDHRPVRKVKAGGWSERHYQQRAEQDWTENAAGVADEIVRLADLVSARLVIIGGDETAKHLIERDLPSRLRDRTHLIEQGRAEDGSESSREREVRRLVATAAASESVELLELAKQELGRNDQAVAGAAATIDALNRAAVEVLFVHDRRAGRVGLTDDIVPLERAGDHAVLADGLVAAALATGAGVRIIPAAGPIREGLGGLLRWSPRTTNDPTGS
jgi:hypothetical protein